MGKSTTLFLSAIWKENWNVIIYAVFNWSVNIISLALASNFMVLVSFILKFLSERFYDEWSLSRHREIVNHFLDQNVFRPIVLKYRYSKVLTLAIYIYILNKTFTLIFTIFW